MSDMITAPAGNTPVQAGPRVHAPFSGEDLGDQFLPFHAQFDVARVERRFAVEESVPGHEELRVDAVPLLGAEQHRAPHDFPGPLPGCFAEPALQRLEHPGQVVEDGVLFAGEVAIERCASSLAESTTRVHFRVVGAYRFAGVAAG